MSSKDQHRTKGFRAAVTEYVYHCQHSGIKPDMATGFILGVLGGVAATLPDLFDDSSAGPGHRGLAHSWKAALLLGTACQRARERGDVATAALLRATLTHLEDDAKTPAGLPSAIESFLRWLLN